MIFEVNVEPLAPRLTRGLDGHLYKGCTDSTPPVVGRDDSVDHERVGEAIPCDVDPTDEMAALARACPPKAVPLNLTNPVVRLVGFMAEAFGVQLFNLIAGELAALLVLDHS